jgi:large subunit ribosomal protein L33
MASSAREIIMLVSTAKTKKGDDTGYFYTTERNKKNNAGEKLSRMKFDPRGWNEKTGKCGIHILFKEKKLPSHK